MDHFVQTVDDMNETILIPCRLMDMKFDQSILTLGKESLKGVSTNKGNVDAVTGKKLLAKLNGVDLFQFYSVINTVKKDLLWGSKCEPTPSASPATISASASSASIVSTGSNNSASLSQVPQGQNTEVKGHARRPSTVSTTSSASASDTGKNSYLFYLVST